MQLMWFCAICFITYAIFSVCAIISLQYNLYYSWPRVEREDEKLPHSPLSGMTTVDHVIKTHVYTTHHPATDGFVNRISIIDYPDRYSLRYQLS
ncbi:hypothetical protein BDF22DRAFT_677189 [Syncephalis plumigaleata]|nr:hypothetical protein BDF22DRAFT_677189 [Syncephalis plumigaleata]